MKRHEALTKLETQTEAVKALGATSLYLFGSTARDAARDDSDVDLFMDYNPDSRFSLLDLVGIKLLLEDHLGVAVDLTTRSSLDPLLKSRIEGSATRIF
jgi:predicted nucleotidyltransferase